VFGILLDVGKGLIIKQVSILVDRLVVAWQLVCVEMFLIIVQCVLKCS